MKTFSVIVLLLCLTNAIALPTLFLGRTYGYQGESYTFTVDSENCPIFPCELKFNLQFLQSGSTEDKPTQVVLTVTNDENSQYEQATINSAVPSYTVFEVIQPSTFTIVTVTTPIATTTNPEFFFDSFLIEKINPNEVGCRALHKRVINYCEFDPLDKNHLENYPEVCKPQCVKTFWDFALCHIPQVQCNDTYCPEEYNQYIYMFASLCADTSENWPNYDTECSIKSDLVDQCMGVGISGGITYDSLPYEFLFNQFACPVKCAEYILDYSKCYSSQQLLNNATCCQDGSRDIDLHDMFTVCLDVIKTEKSSTECADLEAQVETDCLFNPVLNDYTGFICTPTCKITFDLYQTCLNTNNKKAAIARDSRMNWLRQEYGKCGACDSMRAPVVVSCGFDPGLHPYDNAPNAPASHAKCAIDFLNYAQCIGETVLPEYNSECGCGGDDLQEVYNYALKALPRPCEKEGIEATAFCGFDVYAPPYDNAPNYCTPTCASKFVEFRYCLQQQPFHRTDPIVVEAALEYQPLCENPTCNNYTAFLNCGIINMNNGSYLYPDTCSESCAPEFLLYIACFGQMHPELTSETCDQICKEKELFDFASSCRSKLIDNPCVNFTISTEEFDTCTDNYDECIVLLDGIRSVECAGASFLPGNYSLNNPDVSCQNKFNTIWQNCSSTFASRLTKYSDLIDFHALYTGIELTNDCINALLNIDNNICSFQFFTEDINVPTDLKKYDICASKFNEAYRTCILSGNSLSLNQNTYAFERNLILGECNYLKPDLTITRDACFATGIDCAINPLSTTACNDISGAPIIDFEQYCSPICSNDFGLYYDNCVNDYKLQYLLSDLNIFETMHTSCDICSPTKLNNIQTICGWDNGVPPLVCSPACNSVWPEFYTSCYEWQSTAIPAKIVTFNGNCLNQNLPPAVPDKVTSLSSIPYTDQVFLSWLPPSDNRATLSLYKIMTGETINDLVYLQDMHLVDPSMNTFLLIGQTPGTALCIAITACNNVGCGIYSDPTCTFLYQDAPDSPTSLTVSNLLSTSATISWVAPSGINVIYDIVSCVTGGCSSSIVTTTTTVDLINLIPGTTYDVNIKACLAETAGDLVCNTAYSNIATIQVITTQVAPSIPSAPIIFTFNDNSITFDFGLDDSITYNYTIILEKNTGGSVYIFEDIYHGIYTRAVFTGLDRVTKYRAQLKRALPNSDLYSGLSAWTIVETEASLPVAMNIPTITFIRDTGFTVNFQDVTSDYDNGGANIIFIRIRIINVGDSTILYKVVIPPINNIIINNLSPSTSYSISVQAVNYMGFGLFSSPIVESTIGTGPIITSFVASDPDNLDNIFSNNDIITINFDKPTNTPIPVLDDINDLFTFTPPFLGTVEFVWTNSTVFTITFSSADTLNAPAIGSTKVAVKGIILNAAETSYKSPSLPVVTLSGNWGTAEVGNFPELLVTGSLIVPEGGNVVIGDSISILKPETIGFKVYLSCDHGIISDGTTSGASVTLLNSPELVTVQYTPTISYNGNDFIRISLVRSDDVVQYGSDTLPVIVTPMNNPPVISLTSYWTGNSRNAPMDSIVYMQGISISDPDTQTDNIGDVDNMNVIFTSLDSTLLFGYQVTPPATLIVSVAKDTFSNIFSFSGKIADVNTFLPNIQMKTQLINSPIAANFTIVADDVANGGLPAMFDQETLTVRFECDINLPAPIIINAEMDIYFSKIEINFDKGIYCEDCTISCDDFFSNAEVLGIGAECLYIPYKKKLIINVGTGIILSNLELTWITSKIYRCPISNNPISGTFSIDLPVALPKPIVQIKGPKLIGSCASVYIDSVVRYGAIGTLSYSWTSSIAVIPTTVNSLSQYFTISSTKLQFLNPTSFTITLVVTNGLGMSSDPAVITILRDISVIRPALNLYAPTMIYNHKTAYLVAKASLPECYTSDIDSIIYTWSYENEVAEGLGMNEISFDGPIAKIPRYSLPEGIYTFTIHISLLLDSSINNTATAIVNVLAAPLTAVIYGGYEVSLSTTDDLVLDGTYSIDNDYFNNADWVYTYNCKLAEDGSMCLNSITGSPITFDDNGKQTLSAGILESGTYMFTLTVSKVGSTRTSTTRQFVTIVQSIIPLCDIKYQSLTINSNQDVIIVGRCTSELPLTYTWSCNDTDLFNNKIKINKPILFLNADVIKFIPGDYYKFILIAKDSSGATGFVTYVLNINLPPTGGKLSTVPSIGEARKDNFFLKAAQWSDIDEPLTYQFGMLQNDENFKAYTMRQVESFWNYKPLSVGKLYPAVRVFDSRNSFTQTNVTITVTAPAIAANITIIDQYFKNALIGLKQTVDYTAVNNLVREAAACVIDILKSGTSNINDIIKHLTNLVSELQDVAQDVSYDILISSYEVITSDPSALSASIANAALDSLEESVTTYLIDEDIAIENEKKLFSILSKVISSLKLDVPNQDIGSRHLFADDEKILLLERIYYNIEQLFKRNAMGVDINALNAIYELDDGDLYALQSRQLGTDLQDLNIEKVDINGDIVMPDTLVASKVTEDELVDERIIILNNNLWEDAAGTFDESLSAVFTPDVAYTSGESISSMNSQYPISITIRYTNSEGCGMTSCYPACKIWDSTLKQFITSPSIGTSQRVRIPSINGGYVTCVIFLTEQVHVGVFHDVNYQGAESSSYRTTGTALTLSFNVPHTSVTTSWKSDLLLQISDYLEISLSRIDIVSTKSLTLTTSQVIFVIKDLSVLTDGSLSADLADTFRTDWVTTGSPLQLLLAGLFGNFAYTPVISLVEQCSDNSWVAVGKCPTDTGGVPQLIYYVAAGVGAVIFIFAVYYCCIRKRNKSLDTFDAKDIAMDVVTPAGQMGGFSTPQGQAQRQEMPMQPQMQYQPQTQQYQPQQMQQQYQPQQMQQQMPQTQQQMPQTQQQMPQTDGEYDTQTRTPSVGSQQVVAPQMVMMGPGGQPMMMAQQPMMMMTPQGPMMMMPQMMQQQPQMMQQQPQMMQQRPSYDADATY